MTKYLVNMLDLDLTLCTEHLGGDERFFDEVVKQRLNGADNHAEFITYLKGKLRFPEAMAAFIRNPPTHDDVNVIFSVVTFNHRHECIFGVLEALLGENWRDFLPEDHIVMRAVNAERWEQVHNKNLYIEGKLLPKLMVKYGGTLADYTGILLDDTKLHCNNAKEITAFTCGAIHADPDDISGQYIQELRQANITYLATGALPDSIVKPNCVSLSAAACSRSSTPLSDCSNSPSTDDASYDKLRQPIGSSGEFPCFTPTPPLRENTPVVILDDLQISPSVSPTPT